MSGWDNDKSQRMIYEMEQQLTQVRIENWLHHDLFTWQWWVLVAALVLPWLIWWRYVDKTSLQEILLVGLLMVIWSSYLDAVLTELGLWYYHYWVVPLWPRLIAANFTIIPIGYMLIYQIYRPWPSYLVALATLSVVFAIPTEKILIWADIFEIHEWRHIYGVPIFFAMGILVKLVVSFLVRRQERAENHNPMA